ncbi:MAG TPA: hypothetical protein VHE55_16685 [Fimbriimonadaceae bacterium]|nr:hypothetical protein [Fimbriimonadaceae bacterium]
MMLLALFAGSFLLKGGDDSVLVAAVRAATKKDICYLVAPRRTWRKTEIPFKQVGELEVVLKRRYDFGFPEASPSKNDAWSAGAFPVSFFYKQRIFQYEDALRPVVYTPPKEAWPFSLDPAKVKYLTINQIQSLCKDKPLKVHWFFDASRLAIAAEGLDERKLLSLAAHALGGKLQEDKDQFAIGFDPSAFKTRASKMFKEEASAATSKANYLDAMYLDCLYSHLSDAQILKLYASPNEQLTLRLEPGSELADAALARFWERVGPANADENSLRPDQLQMRRQFLAKVDLSKGIWCIVKPDGVPSCQLKGEGNWSLVF